MIISMTGYGKGSSSINGFEAEVEAKTLNHRFLDIFVKLPKPFENREHKVRDVVKKYLERGRLSLSITLRQQDDSAAQLQLNKAQISGYKKILSQLSELLEIDEKPTLAHMLTLPDIFQEDDSLKNDDTVWGCIENAIEAAVINLCKMRKREGIEIQNDLIERVQAISKRVEEIEKLTEGRSKEEFDKLKTRLDSMIDTGDLDASRLELEVALLADRIDVTEECIRLKSHNKVFFEAINSDEPAGRRLNFLLQEMNREANTIGAKCNNSEISHLVVLIKEDIEKLREQVQNVE